MAQGPLIAFHLSREEHAALCEQANASGIRSPALYIRALYRESLSLPENVRRTTAHAETAHRMRRMAARLVVEYLRTISPEELLGEDE